MRRLSRARRLLLGACLIGGAIPIALALVGENRPATVAWSVGSRGARNRTWRITYRYDVDGRRYRGSSAGSRALPAGAPIRVRTLPALPRVASAASDGALWFWGVLWWLPAGLLWRMPPLVRSRTSPRPRTP